MARDVLSTASIIAASGFGLTAYPFSMSAWAIPDSTTNIRHLSQIAADGSNHFRLSTDGATVGDPVVARARDDATAANATTGTFTSGSWQHFGARYGGTASRHAVYQGVPGTENTTSVSWPGTIDAYNMAWDEDSASGYDGKVGEFGLWNVSLADAEWASLAKAFSPLLIRLSALVAYFPMWGNNSPEKPLKGAVTATVTGTAGKFAHGPVIMPFAQF